MEGGFIKSIVFDGRQKFEKILNRIKIKKFIVDYLKYWFCFIISLVIGIEDKFQIYIYDINIF